MTTQPLSWLKQIQEDLTPALKVPLWGFPPSFPWEKLSKQLAEELDISSCFIRLQKTFFCLPHELEDSFGERPIIKTFELSPLSGSFYLMVSFSSLEKIIENTLATEPQGSFDTSLQEGFFQYLLLCSIKAWKEISPYSNLDLHLIKNRPLPSGACFCSDLSISINEDSFPVRLIFSPEFHQEFSSHFEDSPRDFFSSSIAESLNVTLKVEAGTCNLPKEGFDNMGIGDFLILDTCSYDPASHKGTLTLSLEEKPLLRVRIKKDKLKILDYCTYFGDTIAMDEDSDLDPFLPDEEETEETDFGSLEEGFEEEKKTLKETLSSSLDIAFPVTVEIDRIQMPLKKLLSLEPGNVLELTIKPEQGVYLTVHGKKVAKGELIKMGEAIGVKIVELGAPSSS